MATGETRKLPEEAPAEILDGCRRGDRESFRALFELFGERVFTLARYMCREESRARDVAQQTFLKIFASIAGFRGDCRFETWLYRIVVNTARDAARSERRFVSLESDHIEGPRSLAPGGEERLWRRQESAILHSEIARLPPGLRAVVVLRYLEQLSYSEIADVAGCSPGTVASRLSRAHRRLERRLKSRLRPNFEEGT